MPPHAVVAANAVPLRGGQGLCLRNAIEGLAAAFELSVFERDPGSRADAHVPGTVRVPAPGLARAIQAVPVLRRRRDWVTLADDAHFDGAVAARLPKAALVHGATGQCRDTLARARAAGARTVLDSFTVHVDELTAAFDTSCREFGLRSPIHPAHAERMRREYAAADLIRTMSERARRTFLERGFGSDRVIVNPPPFDLADFPVAQFAHDRFRVIAVGALEPWKGFAHLVLAFERLGVSDAELVLWGGSGCRPVTRYLAERTGPARRIRVQAVDVRQHGYNKVYGEASVLVHASFTEGFAFVVGEAMACGLPVIVTDRTGAADLVEDGRNGYVVPAGDADAIRDRLAHLAADPALVRAMGAAARETMRACTMERFRASLVPPLQALLG